MSQILVMKPASQDVHWLFSLRINSQQNRIISCFNKIDRLFRQSRQGDVDSILEVYEWYKLIRHVEGYFDKEIARLTKLINRKVNDRFEYTPYSSQAYRIPVSTPISAAFYRIIHKLDTLACLSETCMTLAIFKKRRLFSKKTDQYKKSLMRVVSCISQHKRGQKFDLKNIKDHREALSIAIHSDVMPVFTKEIFDQLVSLTKIDIQKEA